jgi:hypothetical protein
MRSGESPAENLAAAANASEKALAANPRNSVAYQSAAEVHRWRAEWLNSQGRSIRSEIVAGRSLIERALARNPSSANAMVTGAALTIIQASAETDPTVRGALLGEARSDLRRALEINPLLEAETGDLRRRIEALR